MTKQEKNMRTLIVCFVLLILGLIPLRFIEIKNLMENSQRQSQILGEETQVEIKEVDRVEIVLPNAEVDLFN